eukprot:2390772-Rhodomonas_salina.2
MVERARVCDVTGDEESVRRIAAAQRVSATVSRKLQAAVWNGEKTTEAAAGKADMRVVHAADSDPAVAADGALFNGPSRVLGSSFDQDAVIEEVCGDMFATHPEPTPYTPFKKLPPACDQCLNMPDNVER